MDFKPKMPVILDKSPACLLFPDCAFIRDSRKLPYNFFRPPSNAVLCNHKQFVQKRKKYAGQFRC